MKTRFGGSNLIIYQKFKYLYLNIFILSLAVLASAETEWTTLVYVQAKNNLSPFAVKNFSDMAIIGSNEHVNMLVEWYQPGQSGVWRYKVEKGKMVLDECHHINTDGNSAKDLTDAMQWAVTKYPAKKYALVLWDHGIGILDPQWGNQRANDLYLMKESFDINQEILATNPRIQIDGITMDATVTFTKPVECSFDQALPRGILFNEHSRTYMNNQSLAQALSDIKTKVLKNKKIDLLGMDACLMAMVEVGYLAHQHANILVASQEVELAHGWTYSGLMDLLSIKEATPHQVAQGIIKTYENYYKDKIQFYTQSAINLDFMPRIKEGINNVTTAFKKCLDHDATLISGLVHKARQSCQQFSASSYVDLYSFYSDLHNAICGISNSVNNHIHAFNTLKAELTNCMHLIERSVIAFTCGKQLSRAKGLSIYFPKGRIDRSYQKTEFAKDCLWYEFIQQAQR